MAFGPTQPANGSAPSSQQRTDAITGTANNLASVGLYTGDFSDPPTFATFLVVKRTVRVPRLGQQFLQRDGEAMILYAQP